MKIIYSDVHQAHNPPHEIYDGVMEAYAESAERADSIVAALRQSQLHDLVSPDTFPIQHIQAVHQKHYIEFLRSRSSTLGADDILYPSYFMSDTYAPIAKGTYLASRRAVDAALTGAQFLLDGERATYSLCRPPGHHASHHTMGGYCYFNNAAIAADYLSRHGSVAILDIDFHHGNGTQDVFYKRDDVLYVSLHADPAQSYPYSSGFADEIGWGPGEGFTVNFPLHHQTSDAQYIATLERALSGIVDFEPDFLVVSAGFDTFQLDPIGGLQLTTHAYPEIAERIAGLGLPSLIVQEGGYNIEHLGELVASFLSSFDGYLSSGEAV